MMPSATAGTNASEAFACAVLRAAQPDRASAERVLRRENISTAVANAPTKLPANTIDPVEQERARADLAARPGHHDEVVAGEQLGSADHDQDQAQRKGQAGQKADDAIGQSGGKCRGAVGGRNGDASGAHRGGEQRPERDERAGQDAQHQQGHMVGRRLLDAGFFGTGGHGRRQDRVEGDQLRRPWRPPGRTTGRPSSVHCRCHAAINPRQWRPAGRRSARR